MKIIAFVGASDSGKTRLIARLLPELKRRDLTVAVVKHCGHGFDLGAPNKDSSKFLGAGADGVALVGPDRMAVLCNNQAGSADQVVYSGRVVRPAGRRFSLGVLARKEFGGADIVIVEGGKSDPALRKIEVLRAGVSRDLQTPSNELAAIVADRPVAGADVPLFSPDEVAKIADWLVGGDAPRRTPSVRRPLKP
jgi:molybdopterin-guanine dinucleotide biosynthesis protein B